MTTLITIVGFLSAMLLLIYFIDKSSTKNEINEKDKELLKRKQETVVLRWTGTCWMVLKLGKEGEVVACLKEDWPYKCYCWKYSDDAYWRGERFNSEQSARNALEDYRNMVDPTKDIVVE